MLIMLLLLLIVTVGILALTKPSAESFNIYIRSLVREKRQSLLGKGLTNMIFGGTVDKMVRGAVSRKVDDCIILSIGHWQTDAHWASYIGILNTWICVNSDAEEI